LEVAIKLLRTTMPSRKLTTWRHGLLVLVVTVALVGGGCGSKSSSSSAPGQTSSSQSKTHFAKTKFALHAGLAFGAFHRYIYKPLKRGQFRGGVLHHKLRLIKAAAAALFAYHEVKLALNDARSSKLLSAALAPLLALQTKLSSLGHSLKHGSVNTSEINSANSDAASVSSTGAKAGQPVTDQPTPQLGG
jgi:hypothetical protein